MPDPDPIAALQQLEQEMREAADTQAFTPRETIDAWADRLAQIRTALQGHLLPPSMLCECGARFLAHRYDGTCPNGLGTWRSTGRLFLDGASDPDLDAWAAFRAEGKGASCTRCLSIPCQCGT